MAALVLRKQGEQDRRPPLLLSGFALCQVVRLPGPPSPAVDRGRVEDPIGGSAEDAIRPGPPRPH
jgi:hypothetical protein